MPPFRILCLHGQGVNTAIRSLLPSHYEFIFLAAPHPCAPAPGVANIFPGPYRCWYTSPTTKKVKAAHRLVTEFVESIGGVDGVMGFSQGAALAAGIILHRQLEGKIRLFQVAVFICSPISFSYSLEYGIDTRRDFGVSAETEARKGCPNKVPKYLITDKAYLQGEEDEEDDEMEVGNGRRNGVRQPRAVDDRNEKNSRGDTHDIQHGNANNNDRERQDMKAKKQTFYQMFNASVDRIRIEIPTAHIYGRNDAWRHHSIDLAHLCRSDLAAVHEHAGGHAVPKSAEECERICDVVETAVASM